MWRVVLLLAVILAASGSSQQEQGPVTVVLTEEGGKLCLSGDAGCTECVGDSHWREFDPAGGFDVLVREDAMTLRAGESQARCEWK